MQDIPNLTLVNEPEVELIGRNVMQLDAIERFLSDHGREWPEFQAKSDCSMDMGDRDPEWLIETSARLCYMSYGKGRKHEDHLRHLIEVGHGSVLEHAEFNFLVWNVSRSLTHELVRHRTGMSYSQLSQRYVDESETAFVVPPAIQEMRSSNPEVYSRWMQFIHRSREEYKALSDDLYEHYSHIENASERRKKARQAARSVLPNATETKIAVTMNGRSFRHFVEMRANPAADLEIRRLAVKMFKIMSHRDEGCPLITHGMSLVKLPDGTEGVESQFRKV